MSWKADFKKQEQYGIFRDNMDYGTGSNIVHSFVEEIAQNMAQRGVPATTMTTEFLVDYVQAIIKDHLLPKMERAKRENAIEKIRQETMQKNIKEFIKRVFAETNNKIICIKQYKNMMQCGLAEAKIAVDEILNK